MPRKTLLGLIGIVASVAFFGAPVDAGAAAKSQRASARSAMSGSSKAAKGPSAKPVKTTASSPKTKAAKATAKPSKATTTKSHGGGKTAKSSRPGAAKTTAAAPTSTPSAPTSTPLTTPTSWTPNNPVAQKLSTKSNLLNKVQRSLPPNTDLNAATAGFKNFGQFVAAVNVSNNLGIKFSDLKAAMTGITLAGTPTGQPTSSLGQAIQQFRPRVDATTEAQRAQTQADRAIGETVKAPAAPKSATR